VEILLAKRAGFCFGVKRALQIAERTPNDTSGPIYTLGPLIHNKQVVESLEGKGIRVNDIELVQEGTFIVRSHGVSPEVFEKAKLKGLNLIDATCPFVKRAQELAKEMFDDGYQVIVVGDKDHPEVIGIVGWTNNSAIVVEKPEEAESLPHFQKIGLIAQTTQPRENFEAVAKVLEAKTDNLRFFNTICHATGERQEAARDLSKQVDLMLVVGGVNSANTRKLARICEASGTLTFHIENKNDLKPEWFDGVEKVGLTAGASTPDWIIEEVEKECLKLKTR